MTMYNPLSTLLLRTVLVVIILILISLAYVEPVALEFNAEANTWRPLIVLTPSNWLLIGHINTSNLTITIVSSGSSLRVLVPSIIYNWSILQGSFTDRTLAYVYGNTIRFTPSAFNYSGLVNNVVRSTILTSRLKYVRTITKSLVLKPNTTIDISLWNKSLKIVSDRTSIGMIIEVSIRNYTGSIDEVTVLVSYDNSSIMQRIPTPLGSTPIQAPISLSTLLSFKVNELNSILLKVNSWSGFKGEFDVTLYVIEYKNPYAYIKISNGKVLHCNVYVDLVPPLHLISLDNALRNYIDNILNRIPLPSPNIDVDDQLVFTYSYLVKLEPYNKSLIENSNMSYLLDSLKAIFNSTSIEYRWNTKISLKISQVRNIDLDYIIRIEDFNVVYKPNPVKKGTPICGDGVLGLCMLSYMNMLKGKQSIIRLLKPGIPYTGRTLWVNFPWGVNIGSYDYVPSIQGLATNPLTIIQLYLGYPYSDLIPVLKATWFYGNGSIITHKYGYADNIPVISMEFSGEKYKGSITIDTYYIIPIKAFFNGTSPSWMDAGYIYDAYYNLTLTYIKGFWRNIRAYIIPVNITLANGRKYTGYIIISQPELTKPQAIYNEEKAWIEVKVNPYYPVRIIIWGSSSFISGIGELFSLSLVDTAKTLPPTKLISLPDNYGELLVFHMYNPVNGFIRLVLVDGRPWLIKKVVLGKPLYLGTNKLQLNVLAMATSITEQTTLTKPTSTIHQHKLFDSGIKYVVGGILTILLVVIVVIYWIREKR